MNIEVIALKMIEKGGLMGSASIKIGEIIINEIKILKTAVGFRVAMPSIVWVDHSQKYISPAVELPKQLNNEIQKMILEVYYNREGLFQ